MVTHDTLYQYRVPRHIVPVSVSSWWVVFTTDLKVTDTCGKISTHFCTHRVRQTDIPVFLTLRHSIIHTGIHRDSTPWSLFSSKPRFLHHHIKTQLRTCQSNKIYLRLSPVVDCSILIDNTFTGAISSISYRVNSLFWSLHRFTHDHIP
jgi:hypothetical protein